ncbi:MAG TPA: RHS repeat domain-containing protein [Bryobacteraceae bacterium]
MNSSLRALPFSAVILLLSLTAPAFAQGVTQPLDCSVVASATIAPKLNDFYNFTAQSGDAILIRFQTSSIDPAFTPKLVLIDRLNHLVSARANIQGGPSAGATFAAEFDLTLGGPYQIQILNQTAAQGSYSLVYTYLNKPCGQPALACGAGAVGQIAQPFQLMSYQFPASAGDILSARLSRIGPPVGNSDVAMLAYSATGQLIAGGDTASVGGYRRLDLGAPSDGPVTIVVLDQGGGTGNYGVSVTKLKGQCGGPALSCGSLAKGTLATPVSENSFTVPLGAGDVVSLRYATTDPASTLALVAEVYDPLGNSVPVLFSNVSRTISSTTFTAPSSGDYIAIVRDNTGAATGSYSISMVRLNRPCSATSQTALGCSARVDGSVSGLLGASQYTLTAAANDQYLLRVLRTDQGTGPFQPRLDIYDVQGNLLQTTGTGGLTRATFTTHADGVYTVVVSDGYDGSQTGAYSFSLLRLNRPCSVAATLACGAVSAGSFAQPLNSSVYTYTASSGGSFSARMLDNSGALQPALDVYDSLGNPVGQKVSGSYSGVDVALPAAGTYTIVATDNSTRPTGGPFTVALLQTVNPCAAPAPQGQTAAGVLTASRPFVSYSIPASSGDALLVRSASFTPGFAAQMDLYDPKGSRLDSSTFALSRKLGTSGTYTVIISASAARSAGGYSFSWQLLNSPAATSPLACGGSVTASLSPSGQFRYYLATASSGDLMRLVFNRLSDNFTPQIELFDPSGTRLAQTSDISQRAATDGSYLVVVSPSTSSGETGSFAVAYQRPNRPCSPAALTCGQTALRQVTLPGQLDAFTFLGTAGDQADLRLTQRTGSYFPSVELYDGSGIRVATSTSGLLRYTPQAGGTYALLVRDRGGINTGSYRVSLQDDTNACPVNDTEAPVVTLLQPTGGEVIPGGTLFHIQWQSDDNVGVATHDIALSTDGGKTFATALAAGLGGNQQSFDWTVPADIAPSRNAVIRVTATDGAGISRSASSGTLSIIGSGFTPNSTATYGYDSLNRLTQATSSDGRTVQYTWDAAGNLVQITVTGQ